MKSKITIPFNRFAKTGQEAEHIAAALDTDKLSGDGMYAQLCQDWFEQKLGCPNALLTPSCTHALEMSAMLLDISAGDEVIMPSFTFVSTANAFVLRGARITFIDIRPDTMNMDESLIEPAITSRTKAIVPVHYAGVACEIDTIMEIATRHGLYVVEDAAQGVMATYKGRPLGALGHLAAYSFHETKNYTSGGEGGMLVVNDGRFSKRAEIIREKGTNRSEYFRGMVDKYSWVDIGSSYLPSELQAAFLWAQLTHAEKINLDRRNTWRAYHDAFKPFEDPEHFALPEVPPECSPNAHMFYLKLRDLNERTRFISHLADEGIQAVFHYVPLHSSAAGEKFGRFHGSDRYTTCESERLVRLPLWYGMNEDQVGKVIQAVQKFLQ